MDEPGDKSDGRKRMRKQTIFDLLKERDDDFAQYVVKIDDYREIVTIKYPSGFTWELRGTDFPNRNLIPVYAKNNRGKYVIDHYEQGNEAIPGPSLQKFLDSGETRYVPGKSENLDTSLVQDVVISQEVSA